MDGKKLDIKYINEFIKRQKIEQLHLDEFLGSGTYGQVWSGRFHGIPVVVKVEVLKEGAHPTLYQEYRNYKYLSQVIDVTQNNWKLKAARFSGTAKCLLYASTYGRKSDKNIHRLHIMEDTTSQGDTGQHIRPETSDCSDDSSSYVSSKYSMHMLILSRMGDNLKNIQKELKHEQFSLPTVTLIAMNLLRVLHYIHSHGIVHRDLKPSNVVVSYPDPNDAPELAVRKRQAVYLVDLGLSKPFITRTKEGKNYHIPHRTGSSPVGTVYFMGLDAHACSEASRRDDLQSLAYMLLHFLKGPLPWDKYMRDYNHQKSKCRGHNKKQLTQMRNKWVYQKKKECSTEQLCKGLPDVYGQFLDYCLQLKFRKKPDYRYWIQQFDQVLRTNRIHPMRIRCEWTKNWLESYGAPSKHQLAHPPNVSTTAITTLNTMTVPKHRKDKETTTGDDRETSETRSFSSSVTKRNYKKSYEPGHHEQGQGRLSLRQEDQPERQLQRLEQPQKHNALVAPQTQSDSFVQTWTRNLLQSNCY